MLFSSTLFLFLFLPVTLAFYFALPHAARNAWLLLMSLVFYAWGEPVMVSVMLLSIGLSYGCGLLVEEGTRSVRSRWMVTLAIAANLGLLLFFKYADWIQHALNEYVGLHVPRPSSLVPIESPWHRILFTREGNIRLPIGISFFTFQAMSYVLDVYRGTAQKQFNPLNLAVYKALFPQLIAGPIIRYKDIADQLRRRIVGREGFAYGIARFVVGLGKKVMIANVCAVAADAIFALPTGQLTTPVSWLGIVCYTLQIYFDFSGYSDMAIGLGHMFGFRFKENFAHPYVSRSITEFWRRWHISLSSWFRDYLYIPLGGNRKGPARTAINLLIVFFLCGLWHGASFNFIVWGLYHGTFLVLERVGLGAAVERRRGLNHAYVMLVVMIGWVFFRADTLDLALKYLGAMFGMAGGDGRVVHVSLWLTPTLICALAAGVIGSTPWLPALQARIARTPQGAGRAIALEVVGLAALAVVFVISAALLSANTYNPFIYFRF